LSSFVETLATANARIASLEAELKASQKAYDAATAAKAIAEKSQKSAIAKAKKAEKALADANKEHAQREQAVAERLHTISSAAESKIFDLSLYFRLLLRSCTCCHLSPFSFSFLLLQNLPGCLRRLCQQMMIP
jgi:soluble lytic murein transglycosylase-like protein